MIVRTTRFGDREVANEAVLSFPDGIIGFPGLHTYTIIDHEPGSPFRWLQCVDRPDLAFVIVDPRDFFTDYTVAVGAGEVANIGLTDVASAQLWLIAVVPPDPRQIRVNLRAPVVVNTVARQARQLILSDEYPLRFPLFAQGGL